MKKQIIFLALALIIFSLGLVATFSFTGLQQVYDEIDDSSINASLWNQTTSGATPPTISEDTEKILIRVDNAVDGIGTINSVNLINIEQIYNVSLRYKWNSTGGSGNRGSSFKVFGTRLDGQDITSGDGSGDHTWLIERNASDLSQFIVFRDGAFNRTITAANNIIEMTASSGAINNDVNAELFFVRFTLFGEIGMNLSSPSNNSFFIGTIPFTANLNSSGNTNLTNATLNVWFINGTLFNQTTNLVTGNGTTNTTNWNVSLFPDGLYVWNVVGCSVSSFSDTNCFFADENRSFLSGLDNFIFGNSSDIRETDTAVWNVTLNVSSGVTPTANFYFNGTRRIATATNIGGDRWRFDVPTFQFPTLIGLKNWFWEIFAGSFTHNTTNTNQLLNATNFTLCSSGSVGTQFINFSFTNETVLQQNVTAFIPTSTFTFWLGDGTVNKTTTFSTGSENRSYEFCGSPLDKTLNVDTFFSYDNAGSEQRTFNPGVLSLSRSTTNQTLFLLPTNDGIFVTFQILNSVEQPVPSARVIITRSGFGIIADELTGASGTVNIFLNPNFQYTLTVSAEGFETFETTQAFPTNEFTVRLGGVSSNVPTDFTEGISYEIRPLDTILFNQTTHNFNFTISSSILVLENFGFTLKNSTGTILNSTQSLSSTGGFVGVVLNVGNNTGLTMEAYWKSGGNTTNVSTSWRIITSGGDGFSVPNFLTHLSAYLASGLFGLTNFGLGIVVFLIIFVFSGVLAFKFGLTSPVALSVLILTLTAFFDVGLRLIPNPLNAVPFFPTIFMFIVTLATIIGGRR